MFALPAPSIRDDKTVSLHIDGNETFDYVIMIQSYFVETI